MEANRPRLLFLASQLPPSVVFLCRVREHKVQGTGIGRNLAPPPFHRSKKPCLGPNVKPKPNFQPNSHLGRICEAAGCVCVGGVEKETSYYYLRGACGKDRLLGGSCIPLNVRI